MANEGVVILLMFALFVGGAFMTFDLIDYIYEKNTLGVGFEDIVTGKGTFNMIKSAFWVILVKIVGIALMAFSVWVSINIIRG